MNDVQREVLRRVASTIPEDQLPCPRLELRWSKLEGCRMETYRCEYNYVIPITKGDVREKSAAVQVGSELRFCQGWTDMETYRGHDDFPLDKDGVLSMPFRDGQHIAWDSHSTKLPAYVVWDGGAQSLSPREPEINTPVEDTEPAEDDPNWASKEFRRELESVKKALWRFHSKVEVLRGRHPEHPEGWIRTYHQEMADKVRRLVRGIDDIFFFDFPDWMAEKARSYLVKKVPRDTVVTCAKCGVAVPDDLRGACEHILTPEERAYLERCEGREG